MANEATLIFETEHALPFTVADGTGIEKGALLKMTDPMTAAAADGTNDIIAGIAKGEKIASDGRTKLEVYRGGIFRMKASGAITVGDAVGSLVNYPNHVATITATNLSGAKIVGIAMETAATGDTLLVELNPRAVQAPQG